MMRIHKGAVLVVAVLLSTTACDDGDDPAGPDTGDEISTLTVDAAEGWAFVEFEGGEAMPVEVSDPTQSAGWDLAFNATSVMLNGGAAGPGSVEGYCVCQNAAATDADVTQMTTASERADFEAVTTASLPSETDAWTADALTPAIEGWYAYDITTHQVTAAPENVFAVRAAGGDAFAKLHVIGIEGATQTHPGTVTIEYAFQPAAGAAFDEVRTVQLDASGGEVLLDLESGSVVSDESWDLRIDGWDLRVNGGVSGPGQAGAYLTGESFDAIDDAGAAPAGAFSTDEFGGVFDEHAWYRYDIEGNHQIWPTYDVFLIRDGGAVYKVQITGYYGPTGDSRQVTFRYERLD